MKIPAAGLPLAMRTAKLSTQNINETNTAQKIDHPVYKSRSKNDINVLVFVLVWHGSDMATGGHHCHCPSWQRRLH